MSLLKDFKSFAMKGNLIDMASGIIMGVALKAVVTSLVNDVIMPPVGKALGGVDFSKLFINLSDTAYATLAEATEASAPVIRYGVFIQSIIDFLIIAFVVFVIVKILVKKQEATPAPTPEDTLLLREIRDSLKK